MRDFIIKIRNALLANKQFLYLWLSQIFTQSAVSIVTLIISILSHEGVLSEETASSSAGIGVIVNLSTLPGLFIAPFAGVLADRYSKKKIMIVSDIARIIMLVVFVLVSGWNNMWISYFLIFGLSSVLQFFIPAEGGLLPKLVKRKYIIIANSLFTLTVYSTLAVGVALSGPLLSIFGKQGVFILSVVFLFVSVGLLTLKLKIPGDKDKKRINKKSLKKQVKSIFRDTLEGFKYLLSRRILKFALVHLFLLQIVGLTLLTMVFNIGEEIYGVSPREAGIVVFAPIVLGLMIGLGTLNIIFRSKNRVKIIWLGTISTFLGFGFMAIVGDMNGKLAEMSLDQVFASVSLILVGIGLPFLLIPGQTLIYENTLEKYRSRILGIWISLTSSLASIVSLGIGYFMDNSGGVVEGLKILVFVNFLYFLVIGGLIYKHWKNVRYK